MSEISTEKVKEQRKSIWQVSALQAAAPIVVSLEECEVELREEAVILFRQLASGELDSDEEYATAALLAEILFPNHDGNGAQESERDLLEPSEQGSTDVVSIREKMDDQEASFAENLRLIMDQKGVTQSELAKKIGIGQPAISMMLQRECRPQKRTVLRIAQALEVEPFEIWPMSN